MISLIELLAVVVSGTYGVLLARRKGMDFVGIFSIAFATAFGGGTLRDLCIDRHPLFWVENYHYTIIVFGLALLMSILRQVPKWLEKMLPLPDALGLGLFSVAGVSVALEHNMPVFIAILMGVVTGTFGGVIGDIVCNELPSLFIPSTPFYATASFVGSGLYLAGVFAGLPESFNLFGAIAFIVVLRLLALHWNWHLPIQSG